MADNQNKLEDIIGGALELLNDPDYGYDIHPDDLLEVKSVLVTRITANYTPNSEVQALVATSMADAAEEASKDAINQLTMGGEWVSASEVMERERVARLDERKRYIEVLNLFGTPICDSLHHPKKYQHGGTESCPVVERIAKLAKDKL